MAKWVVTLEYKVFGNLTGKLFGSGAREIIINEAQGDKTADSKPL